MTPWWGHLTVPPDITAYLVGLRPSGGGGGGGGGQPASKQLALLGPPLTLSNTCIHPHTLRGSDVSLIVAE